VLGFTLLKHISFIFNQITQHRAAAPNKIWFISFFRSRSPHTRPSLEVFTWVRDTLFDRCRSGGSNPRHGQSTPMCFATGPSPWSISFHGIPSSQWSKQIGKKTRRRLNSICDIYMVFQINLAKRQSKNNYYIVSMKLQKQHLRLPCQILFARLSFVRVTPFQRYHKII
jgi:hypothetical protein